MGVSAGTRTISDGLVLALDAANTRSYPGSGTTWFDLSDRGNNGTLTNGPSFVRPTFTEPFGGAGSVYFDGTGDYLNFGSSPYTGFGTGDFTLECWVYIQVSGSMAIYDGRYSSSATGFALSYDTTNGLKVFYGGGNRIVGGTISANAWNHVAVARASGSTRLYVNGSQVGSTYADTNDYTSGAQNAFIGAGYNVSAFWNGYISNFRVINGTALYTQNFTPKRESFVTQSSPYTSLLTCQNGTIRDASPNNFTITRVGNVTPVSYAPYISFDGTDDYVPLTNNSLPTGNYTINCWVKTPSVIPVTQYDIIISTSQYFWYLGIYLDKFTIDNSDGTFRFGPTLSANTWYNVAVTRSGSTDTAYINGVSQGTNTNSAALSGNWEIGRWAYSPSHYWTSSISQISIYNRALTATEVSQNYQNIKSRYGL